MATVYCHPTPTPSMLCAPSDPFTRAELLAKTGFYSYPHAKRKGSGLVCHACGMDLVEMRGQFHVFTWRGDGGYRAEDSLGVRERRNDAETLAYKLGSNTVVRFLAH